MLAERTIPQYFNDRRYLPNQRMSIITNRRHRFRGFQEEVEAESRENRPKDMAASAESTDVTRTRTAGYPSSLALLAYVAAMEAEERQRRPATPTPEAPQNTFATSTPLSRPVPIPNRTFESEAPESGLEAVTLKTSRFDAPREKMVSPLPPSPTVPTEFQWPDTPKGEPDEAFYRFDKDENDNDVLPPPLPPKKRRRCCLQALFKDFP